MKLSNWAFALAIAAVCWPGAAVFAQIGSGVIPQNRTSGNPVTYNYGDYYNSQPAQDPPVVPEAAVVEEAAEEEEEAPQPWRIFNQDNAWGVSARGYLAQSYTWNPQNPIDKFNGPVTWTDRANEYQLNEFYGITERVTNTENSVMDIGGRLDLMYGTSARFCTAAGLEDNWNHGRSFYGLCMPQAYGDVALNDWKLRAGHFISPVGYFAVGTINNFFNTLPYTFQYGEPFTHTGMTLTKKFNDELTAGAGVIQGWDNFGTSFNSHAGYLGTLNYTRADVGDSIAFVQVYSLEPNFTGGAFPVRPNFSPRYLQTFVYSRPLKQINENLTWIFQTDFGAQSEALASGKSAQWYGINQYLFLQSSDTLAWGGGFEWFRDDDGFRVGGFLPNFSSIPAGGAPLKPRGLATTRSGYVGNFFQMTLGPKWTPNLNTIIRPNLRWDWFDGASPTTGPGGTFNRPFDDGTKNWQVIANVDVILQF